MKTFVHLASCILLLSSIVACGCKSHKAAVVNTQQPVFNAEEVWVLTEMRGKEVVYAEGQTKATIQINPEAGTFSGKNGCNQYMGTFKDFGNGKMELSDFNGTKMLCPEPFRKFEVNFMQAIHKCNGYNLGEYSLDLLDDEKVLLHFERVTPQGN